mmetsp:Transcript_37752/g.87247  ORF Transcript_37752/g.87247 Transcript_37752/m.87247 type:complete len:279 (+) Transcript_37752:749-1585(+)
MWRQLSGWPAFAGRPWRMKVCQMTGWSLAAASNPRDGLEDHRPEFDSRPFGVPHLLAARLARLVSEVHADRFHRNRQMDEHHHRLRQVLCTRCLRSVDTVPQMLLRNPTWMPAERLRDRKRSSGQCMKEYEGTVLHRPQQGQRCDHVLKWSHQKHVLRRLSPTRTRRRELKRRVHQHHRQHLRYHRRELSQRELPVARQSHRQSQGLKAMPNTNKPEVLPSRRTGLQPSHPALMCHLRAQAVPALVHRMLGMQAEQVLRDHSLSLQERKEGRRAAWIL